LQFKSVKLHYEIAKHSFFLEELIAGNSLDDFTFLKQAKFKVLHHLDEISDIFRILMHRRKITIPEISSGLTFVVTEIKH